MRSKNTPTFEEFMKKYNEDIVPWAATLHLGQLEMVRRLFEHEARHEECKMRLAEEAEAQRKAEQRTKANPAQDIPVNTSR